MCKFKENKRIFHSKVLAFSLIFSFILLIATEAAPRKANLDSNEEFTPVVKVRETQQEIPEVQKKIFDRLIEEGKKLLQEEMDYEGAINKFREAQDFAIIREQKADALFYLSLAHYATIDEKGKEEFEVTIRKLIEIDYYRELDTLLCPPRYVELFRGIKKEYGALRVHSKPAGADVYLDDSKDSAGKTPVTIGAKAGTVKIRLKRGKQEKKDTLRVIAEEITTSPTYILKGKSSLIYVIGGIVLAGGVGAALLSGRKGNGGGTPTPSPGPTTGSIQVNSNPTEAQVYLDGNDTGRTTNTTLTDVSLGSHAVKLIKEGYIDYEENVSVTAGQTATVNATLTEIISGDYVFITKWGSQGSGDGQFDEPHGIAVDGDGYVYVADTYNCRIQKFTSDGTFVKKWGSWGLGDGQFQYLEGIAVDKSRNVYVTDTRNYRIQKFSSNGTFITKWGSWGDGDGQFRHPIGIAVDGNGFVYVTDVVQECIQKFTSEGKFIARWEHEDFGYPGGIVVDEYDYVYVAEDNRNSILKFTSDGVFIVNWHSYGIGHGIALDEQGYLYVSDNKRDFIKKFTSDGTFVAEWGSEGSGDGQLKYPFGVAVDGDGYVYVADEGNYRIQKFGPASAIQKITEKTYSPLNNHSLNRNLRPRPGLLNHPARDRLKKKQDLMNKKVRRGKGKDGK